MVIVALGANSLALPRSALVKFGIRTQNLHIDHLEHEVDELEHKLGNLSKEVTPWDVQMLEGRIHRLEDDKCPTGEVSCGGDFPECVSHLFICDGRVDCHNGRDEDEDVCDSEVVHVGRTYQGVIEWRACETLPDSNVIMTITHVHHVPFFNNVVFLQGVVINNAANYIGQFDGQYSFANRQLVLIHEAGKWYKPYRTICTFYFGDNAHADCTVHELGSSHQCAKVRMVKV